MRNKMGWWKGLKPWQKGIFLSEAFLVLQIVLFLLILALDLVHINLSGSLLITFPIGIVLAIFFFSGREFLPFITYLLFFILFYSIIGALIGWLVGKFKNKSK